MYALDGGKLCAVAVHREREHFINKRRSQKLRESLLGCCPVNHEGTPMLL